MVLNSLRPELVQRTAELLAALVYYISEKSTIGRDILRALLTELVAVIADATVEIVDIAYYVK